MHTHDRFTAIFRWIRPSAAALIAVGPLGAAHAQEEVCSAQFTRAEFIEAVDAVDAAIADANGLLAQRILDDVYDAMRCLGVRVDPSLLGHYARQNSVVAFYAQDIEEATAWAQLGREALGETPWPEDYPITDGYRQLLEDLPEMTLSGPDNAGFLRPKGGAVFVDGRFAEIPEAAVGVPHLLQILDKRQRTVHTSWVDGMAFPEEHLGNPSTVNRPRWAEDPPPPPGADAALDPQEPEPSEPETVEPEPETVEPEPETVEPEPSEPAEPEPSEPAETEEPALDFDEARAARDCAWKTAPKKVSTTGRTVTINRHTYDVRTAGEQAAFRKVLRSCGEFRATRRFNRWREARAQLFSFDARVHRDRMEKALLTEEPRRRRDRSSLSPSPKLP